MASLCGSSKGICVGDDDVAVEKKKKPRPVEEPAQSRLAALFAVSTKPKEPKRETSISCEVCVLAFGASALPIIDELRRRGADFFVLRKEGDFLCGEDVLPPFPTEGGATSSFPFSTAAERREYVDKSLGKVESFDKATIRESKVGKLEIRARDLTVECDSVVVDAERVDERFAKIAKEIQNVRDSTVVVDGFTQEAAALIGKLVVQNNTVHVKAADFRTLDVVLPNDAPLDEAQPHLLCNEHPTAYSLSMPTGPASVCCAMPPSFQRKKKILKKIFKNADDASAGTTRCWAVEKYFDLYERHRDHMLASNVLLNDVWFLEAIGKCRLHTNLEVSPSSRSVADDDDGADFCAGATKTTTKTGLPERRVYEGAYVDDETGKPTAFVAQKYYKLHTTTTTTRDDEDVDSSFLSDVTFLDDQGEAVEVKRGDLYRGMLHRRLRRVFFCGTLEPRGGPLLPETYRLFYKRVVLDDPKTLATYFKALNEDDAQPQPQPQKVVVVPGIFADDVARNELGLGFRRRQRATVGENVANYLAYLVGPTTPMKLDLMDAGYQDKALLAAYREDVAARTSTLRAATLTKAALAYLFDGFQFRLLAVLAVLRALYDFATDPLDDAVGSLVFYANLQTNNYNNAQALRVTGLVPRLLSGGAFFSSSSSSSPSLALAFASYCVLVDVLCRESLAAMALFRHATPASAVCLGLVVLRRNTPPPLVVFLALQAAFVARAYLNPPTTFPNLANNWQRKAAGQDRLDAFKKKFDQYVLDYFAHRRPQPPPTTNKLRRGGTRR
mmetsp:Transcript_20885/g.67267  ORF Transcript_20885/g.67267 Transcript_20885/m.67267 type:complete len:784 (+) Transcript_20885:19-2370(+)